MRLKLLSFLLLFVGASGFGQSIFTNPITGTNPNTGNPYTTGQLINPNITVSGIGRGAGINGTNANDRYNANGWNTTTIDLAAYFEFTITPNTGYTIDFVNLVYTAQRSNTSISNFAFRSSVDGFNSNIGIPTFNGATIDLSSFQNISGPITFRFYAWGASVSTTTFSINNFTFNGNVNSTSLPNINVSPLSLTGLDYASGTGPSAEQSFTVSGTNLTNDINLTAPANFEISTTSGSGFGPNVTLTESGGDVANTAIYTRLVGGLANGNYTGNINAISTGAAAQNVAASGTVIADVVITEIMYDTLGANDLEWIEICNLTGSAQNISNYQIEVNGTTRFTFPAGANIPDNSCITVRIGYLASSPAPECPFTPSFSNPIGTTDILANTSRTITLLASDGVSVADEVTYSEADGADGNGSTLHVIDATVDNSITGNGNWTEVSNGGSPGVNTVVAPCAVQNIVVRGDIGTFPTISSDGSNTPIGTDNTLFAAQTIGNSQDKTFRIANEGTLPLTIASITIGGANPADFSITQMPSFNIAASTFDLLEISFSPLAGGQRNATVTVASDDPDTPSYVFNIRGTGICAVSSPTLSPSSGPTGTIVTLTGENFGGSTTLTYQGSPVAVTIISTTQLEFEIPAGAGSGTAAFTNNIGCQGTASFTVLNNTITSCEGTAGSVPSDLFISEVTDATFGGLTYIEIFNATGGNVALGDYALQLFYNGSDTPQYTLNLDTVNLLNLNTYVVAIGMGPSNCSVLGGDGSFADQSTTQAGINVVNDEHDMIRLVKNGASELVDEFGVYEDENWINATIITGDRGFNFRRLNTAGTLPRVPFNLSDWEVIDWAGTGSTTCLTNNDYSNIGVYDFSLGIPPSTTPPVVTSSNCLEATITVTATEGVASGNALTYQWYAVVPGDSNWIALSDDAVYSGVSTNELIINNTFNLNNYQYYCEVRENTATCSQASDAVRIEIEQTTWDGTTWNPAPPDANTLAIIEGFYDSETQGSFSACNLIINSGEVNIANGDYIEVYNNVSIESTAALPRLRVQPQGAFVQVNNNGTVIGNARINKETAPMNFWYEYTYWSSPVNNAIVETTLFQSNANRRFWFNAQNYLDETAEINNNGATVPGQDDIDDNGNDWTLANGTDVMVPGRGYAATLSPIAFVFGPGSQYLFNFDGVMNNGIITVPIYRNDNEMADNNWNFIGNPYPSAINADTFLTENTMLLNESAGASAGAIFLWSQNTDASGTANGNENLNFAQADYAVINGTGETQGGDGVWPNRFIPSGQGFFVAMDNGATATNIGGNIFRADITFNNAMRVTGDNNQFFRAPNVSQPDKLWLNLTSDNGVFNQILVAYVPGATNNDDGMYYDASRNLSTGTYASLYSIIAQSDKPFAIQGKNPMSLNPDEVIPLGFSTSIEVATLYSISIAQLQGDFMTSETVYLKDNLLNSLHNLSESDYTFTSEVGDFKERFEVVFNRESLSVGEALLSPQSLSIIELSNGDVQFSVAENHQIKTIEIIDLQGRTIYRLKGASNLETSNLSQLSSAAYVAKVTLSNGQTINKKAIKRL